MPHGSYTVSPEHLKEAKKIAAKYNGLYHIHAAETLTEQSDINERYEGVGYKASALMGY